MNFCDLQRLPEPLIIKPTGRAEYFEVGITLFTCPACPLLCYPSIPSVWHACNLLYSPVICSFKGYRLLHCSPSVSTLLAENVWLHFSTLSRGEVPRAEAGALQCYQLPEDAIRTDDRWALAPSPALPADSMPLSCQSLEELFLSDLGIPLRLANLLPSTRVHLQCLGSLRLLCCDCLMHSRWEGCELTVPFSVHLQCLGYSRCLCCRR